MRQIPVQGPGEDSPLTDFSSCHEGIVARLKTFGELPALVAPAARVREIAEETLQFFQGAVFDHHVEEEKDLFPAVLAAAEGEERDKVRAMVKEFTTEHRAIEALWAELEPQLEKLAKGKLGELDGAAVADLVSMYRAHARLEESEFLPLAEKILGRNSAEMAALGLSLHTRHVFRSWRRGIHAS